MNGNRGKTTIHTFINDLSLFGRDASAAVGGIERAHHSTEGLAQGLCHMHGDVVEAGPRVVMSRRAAGHAVLYGVSLFHFLFPAAKPLGTVLFYCNLCLVDDIDTSMVDRRFDGLTRINIKRGQRDA